MPGFKLADGRATRSWRDAEQVKAFFERNGLDPYQPKKLHTPASAEKALRQHPELKELLKLLIVTERPENDKIVKDYGDE